MGPRAVVRGLLERVTLLSGATPRQMAGKSLILAYHNVVPDGMQGRGDSSLHLPLSQFLRQLDLLQEHCSVTNLADLLKGQQAAGKPGIGLTFDDAYRGAVEVAFPELKRRGLPATLFVTPGMLGCRSMWWDELAREGKGLSEALRTRALEVHAGQAGRIREAWPGPTPLPDCYAIASEAAVMTLAQDPLFSVGAHSWSHPNLVQLSPEDLATELGEPLRWLAARTAHSLPILAYPYGRSAQSVEEAARRVGYQAALLVEGGWFHAPWVHPLGTPRYNVPAGLSEHGFLLLLSGRRRT